MCVHFLARRVYLSCSRCDFCITWHYRAEIWERFREWCAWMYASLRLHRVCLRKFAYEWAIMWICVGLCVPQLCEGVKACDCMCGFAYVHAWLDAYSNIPWLRIRGFPKEKLSFFIHALGLWFMVDCWAHVHVLKIDIILLRVCA